MIRINRLSLAFAQQQLYREISLHIRPRQRLGLVGDNGSGKTTLLRLIMGL
jgi:ATP-binding cassette subfamily F protein 3